MHRWIHLGLSAALLSAAPTNAQQHDVLTDHGVAAPTGMAVWGGPVATVDAAGRRIIAMKLWVYGSSRHSYYLFVDAETGESEQMDAGLPGYGAWATFLSPDNKLYDSLGETGQGNVFLEVDVNTRTVEQIGPLPPDRPSSMTIDDNGLIWIGMDPGAELFSFDPRTRELLNHGPMAERAWRQYPKIACDDSGWVYATIVFQESNILAYNSHTGEKRELLDEVHRGPVTNTSLWRAIDGRVYAWLDFDKQWYQLHDGNITVVDEPSRDREVYDNTTTVPGVFPDGSRWTGYEIANRRAWMLDAGAKEPRELAFDYESGGVDIYSVVADAEGNICGSTGAPLRIFKFDPATGSMTDGGLAEHGGHVNQFVLQDNKLYGGVYGTGSLIEYDPSLPIDDRSITQSSNPRHLHGYDEAQTLYGRPHALLAHPDGQHVLLTGNPYRSLVGTGILIYNTATGEETVLRREQLIADQGIMALAALPNGDVIAGTMTYAATGGTATATEALVYKLDWTTKQIAATWTPVPGARAIHDLIVVPDDGLIYGLTPGSVFFVLNPDSGEVLHRENLSGYGNLAANQAPRIMALAPDGGIYVLFRNAIIRIQPTTFEHKELLRTEIPISAGTAIVNGRLYFASGTRLWSYKLPEL